MKNESEKAGERESGTETTDGHEFTRIMKEPIKRYFVFDVESVGLHGEGYAAGFVVLDAEGNKLDSGCFACAPHAARGNEEGFQWIKENAPSLHCSHDSPWQVRAAFWRKWVEHKMPGTVMVADCGWPVEARFLIQCIEDHPVERTWGGPYPFHELATLMVACGMDPLETRERNSGENPKHDPLADALQSARLLIECVRAVEK